MTRSRALALSVLLLFAATGVAAAAGSPFGVGLPEPTPSAGGLFPELFRTIAAWQSAFYKDLTATIGRLKTDGTAAFWLAGASFLYGVLHAAGPGHGKAIVSAYVLANGETARNGAVLALVSAFAQGVTAVLLVAVAAIALGATSMAMTRAAEWLEIGSFALIVALGVWLVWRKILKPLADGLSLRYAPVSLSPLAAEAVLMRHDHDEPVPARQAARHQHHHDHHHHHHHHGHDHRHDHAHGHEGGHGHGHDHRTHHAAVACGCGHVHAASPALAAGPLDWRKAWTTVLAVGLRPCTGALIVLVFSLSQGLIWAGIGATFAMAAGTGLTVAALTLAAVSARGLATRIAGGGESALAHRLHMGFEALGALAVLGFGLLMLGASLS